MDLQLFATVEELREFPENKTDSNTTNTANTAPDKTPSPKYINLIASDLPRPPTDLLQFLAILPDSKIRHRNRRSRRHKSRSKNSTRGHSVIQVNDHIGSKQEKQRVIQTTNEAYLNQLVGHSAGPPPEAVLPVVGQPLVGQPVAGPLPAAFPVVSQPGVSRSSLDQPSSPIPPLLSLRLQPDLNALAWTLSPQALWYVHLGIQIGQNLLN